MTPLEAELPTEIYAQCFGAYKVTYFNACREYCEKMGLIGVQFIPGVLAFWSTSATHTPMFHSLIKFGCGGKCFPKDNAFAR